MSKNARPGGPAPYARDPRGSAGQEVAAKTVEEEAVEIDFNDPNCKACDFRTKAQDIQAAMLRHYAGHDPSAEVR